jgi:DNA-binding MarR family transcriptional regulator
MNDRGAQVHAAIAALQRLTQLFTDRRAQLAGGVDLTEQQWQVLEEIATEHFMPSMFARTRDSSAPAVSRTLRQLLEKQLVAVSVSPDDGRQRRYELTGKGMRTMAKLRAARQAAIDAIWMDLNPAQVRAFARFARDLSARLERYVGQTD